MRLTPTASPTIGSRRDGREARPTPVQRPDDEGDAAVEDHRVQRVAARKAVVGEDLRPRELGPGPGEERLHRQLAGRGCRASRRSGTRATGHAPSAAATRRARPAPAGSRRSSRGSVIAVIAASIPGDEIPWRNGLAHASRANTSWDRTPSATDPNTTRQAVRPANPTTTVAVASPSSGADGRCAGAIDPSAGACPVSAPRGPPSPPTGSPDPSLMPSSSPPVVDGPPTHRGE